MPEKVLIVDDDLTVNVVVSKTLIKGGFETRTAFSVEEALGRVQQERFDLVITDIRLPKVDGFEFLKRLNDLGVTDSVPIIVLSGHLEGNMGRQAQNLGATDLVAKPFDPGELVLRARRAIERGPRAALSQRWAKPPASAAPAAPASAPASAPPAVAPPPAAAAPPAPPTRDARSGGKLAQELAPPSTERTDCAGTLENIQPAELVRFLFFSRRSGLIETTHEDERGEIVVREGEVLRAAIFQGTAETMRALVALRGIFAWRSGRFRVCFRDVGVGSALPKTTAAILTEAFGGSIDYSKMRSGPT
jgi:CheY-like chemotaxis protein